MQKRQAYMQKLLALYIIRYRLVHRYRPLALLFPIACAPVLVVFTSVTCRLCSLFAQSEELEAEVLSLY